MLYINVLYTLFREVSLDEQLRGGYIMFKKILEVGKKISVNPKVIIAFLVGKGPFQWLSDELYIKLMYYGYFGKKLNFDNPTTFNEKLQWLKLNDRRPERTSYVDKYAVRKYIKDIIGEEYLVPLLGVYDKFEDIDFKELPNQFVLKCTHDSGGLVICKDKNSLNKLSARKKINKSLKRKFYYYGREWPYKGVNPKVICEHYLEDNLVDYKFMCFNGEPKLIQIHRDRDTNHTLDFYDLNWNKTEIRKHKNTATENIPIPNKFEEMVEIAKKLSVDELHVRIDLYEVNGKIYFGEKTYYSASGFSPFANDEYDKMLGKFIEIQQ